MQTVLFLCTGNYYRSRFSEYLFNHRAMQTALNWRADSRGIATDYGAGNIGPISAFAVQGLYHYGIQVGSNARFPRQLEEQDLSAADLVIALHQIEHKPLMQARFPQWVERIEYWNVADLDLAPAETAWQLMAHQIESLINRFKSQC